MNDRSIVKNSESQSQLRQEGFSRSCSANPRRPYCSTVRLSADTIRSIEGDTVVVTGHTKMDAIVEGKPKLLNSRYTNVWIKGAQGWQMVVWQSTPIPAPAA